MKNRSIPQTSANQNAADQATPQIDLNEVVTDLLSKVKLKNYTAKAETEVFQEFIAKIHAVKIALTSVEVGQDDQIAPVRPHRYITLIAAFITADQDADYLRLTYSDFVDHIALQITKSDDKLIYARKSNGEFKKYKFDDDD